MIVQLDFLNRLKALGLNSYEAKLWVALLSVGTATAGELSDIANVPRSRSYDVLEGLEKKGFIIMQIGKPIKYLAISPNEVLGRVKDTISDAYLEREKAMGTFQKSEFMAELDDLHNKGMKLVEPTDISGSIKGRSKIYSRLQTMIKNAEKKIVIVTTNEGAHRKSTFLKKSLEKAKLKGVDISIYSPHSISSNFGKELKNIANLKNSKDLKSRMCVVDGSEVLLMLLDEGGAHEDSDVAVWLKAPFIASALNTMIQNN